MPNTLEAKADNDDGDKGGSSRGTDVPKLGLTLAPANSVAGAGKEGVVVTEVDPKSAAAERGFKEGDVILEVAGKSVANVGDVREAITAARSDNKNSVLMRVKRTAVHRASSRCRWPRADARDVYEMGSVAGIVAPADGSFRGAGQKLAPYGLLPSGGIRPPPSEGSKGGEVPQLHRPLFLNDREIAGRLA